MINATGANWASVAKRACFRGTCSSIGAGWHQPAVAQLLSGAPGGPDHCGSARHRASRQRRPRRPAAAPLQQLRIIPVAFCRHIAGVQNRVGLPRTSSITAFAKSLKLFLAHQPVDRLGSTFLADPLVELLLGENRLNTAAAHVGPVRSG